MDVCFVDMGTLWCITMDLINGIASWIVKEYKGNSDVDIDKGV